MNPTVCCFCAEPVGETPVEIAASFEGPLRQTLWAHAACLSTRLHPSAPTLLPSSTSGVLLTERQAYQAMFAFLEQQYNLSHPEELAILLGSMALLPDGTPADAALRDDWKKAIRASLSGRVGSH